MNDDMNDTNKCCSLDQRHVSTFRSNDDACMYADAYIYILVTDDT